MRQLTTTALIGAALIACLAACDQAETGRIDTIPIEETTSTRQDPAETTTSEPDPTTEALDDVDTEELKEIMFLDMLTEYGGPTSQPNGENDARLIDMGNHVCASFDDGGELSGIVLYFQLTDEYDDLELDNEGIGHVIGAAVSTLCFEHHSTVMEES